MKKGEKNKKSVKIYSALETANICGVVNQTAINWIQNGYLKAFKTPGGQYRVYKDELLKFMRERNIRIPPHILSDETSSANKTLLVIDSDIQQNNSLAAFLSMQIPALSVYQAFNSFSAGFLIARFIPKFIFINFDSKNMPIKDICIQIRNDKTFSETYTALLISSESDLDTNIQKEYFDLVLRKPLDYIGILTELYNLMK